MNKTFLEFLKSQNLKPGCISKSLETVSKRSMKKIMGAIQWGQDTDVAIRIGRKKHIAEIIMESLEGEVDVVILTPQEYETRYGSELLKSMEW